ncbi:hypothetical protein [Mycolicibacterium llatzerense]|uniref:hypothetical protein n=1 Tax=Mycolicibacterium llatzerense TaxID=280871 RepID=UPI0008DC86E5|nr:hypothetical protein [Mycolicibacterium llatzerense]
MSVIRVNYLPEFHFGDDAVLLTLDRSGVDQFRAAVIRGARHGSATLEHDGVVHDVRIEAGAAHIELTTTHVVWRLDNAKATEISAGLAALRDESESGTTGGGHFYVDMTGPAETLVVSRDEYVTVTYPWHPPA